MSSSAAEYDSEAWQTERDANLARWFLDDQDAIALVHILGDISETWDDLIDEDQVEPERINRMMYLAMVELAKNPVYQKHAAIIGPIVLMAINAWLDATEMQQHPEVRCRQWAFYLRDMIIEIVPLVAYLIGGFDHLRAVSVDIRTALTHERFSDWEFSNDEPGK